MTRIHAAAIRPASIDEAPGHRVAARLLLQWLAVGVLLTLLFPAARASSELIGPLNFWLLGAPLASLAVFHRHALAPVRRRAA